MENPSILSHVSIGTDNYEESLKFYDAVLATIGAKRVMEHPGAAAYGKEYPEFWIGKPLDGCSSHPGNGVHFGFVASSKEEVDELYMFSVKA